jgi:hypothetical protein
MRLAMVSMDELAVYSGMHHADHFTSILSLQFAACSGGQHPRSAAGSCIA